MFGSTGNSQDTDYSERLTSFVKSVLILVERHTHTQKKGGKIKLHFYPKWVETSSQEEKNFWTTVMCLLFFITRRYDFGVLLSDFRSE